MRLKKDTDFTDPGATATDNVDGNITDKITTVSDVNTSVTGSYTVSYKVEDNASNEANKTRTVTVYEFHFTSNTADTVNECQPNIHTVTTADSTGEVTYAIAKNDSNATEINASTGVLSFKAKKLPDHESKDEYKITVKATDIDNESIEQNITIAVDSVIINFNSKDYGCVPSPYTGKVWLDRNIGANRICTSVTDIECYGDYFQWGRNADGHESNTSESNDTLATRIYPVQDGLESQFITTARNIGDWVDTNNIGENNDTNGSKRMANWQTYNNTSTVCPDKYYVATDDDIAYELFENNNSAQIDKNSSEVAGNSDNRLENAVNSFMKIPANGKKEKSNSIDNNGSEANLWTSYSEYDGFDLEPSSLFIEPDSGEVDLFEAPVYGMAIRCIKQ